MRHITLSAVGIGALLLATLAVASPASAKNNCGPLGLYRDGALKPTGHVVQSCDKGTNATYNVRCPLGNTQFSRSYPVALTATTNVSCAANVGPIISVDVSYR